MLHFGSSARMYRIIVPHWFLGATTVRSSAIQTPQLLTSRSFSSNSVTKSHNARQSPCRPSGQPCRTPTEYQKDSTTSPLDTKNSSPGSPYNRFSMRASAGNLTSACCIICFLLTLLYADLRSYCSAAGYLCMFPSASSCSREMLSSAVLKAISSPLGTPKPSCLTFFSCLAKSLLSCAQAMMAVTLRSAEGMTIGRASLSPSSLTLPLSPASCMPDLKMGL